MDSVPTVEVDQSNVSDVLPSIVLAINTSSFIALDLELSGLGNRKLLQSKNIEDRYKQICEVSNSRSILALGISCFKRQHSCNQVVFVSQSFNILTMCMDNYIIEPRSIKFLVDHAFNFNRQYSSGLPYHRFNMEHEILLKEAITKKKSKKNSTKAPFKESILSIIFKSIITCKVPVVFHNALVDLVFLYSNLYSSPPEKLTQFMTDVHLMFPAGVVDTKVLAEFKEHMNASYLDYVFKKCQRENSRGCERLLVEFVSYLPIVQHLLTCFDCSLLHDDDVLRDQSQALCLNYANHGWCPDASNCSKSHSIHLVLCIEEADPKRLQTYTSNVNGSFTQSTLDKGNKKPLIGNNINNIQSSNKSISVDNSDINDSDTITTATNNGNNSNNNGRNNQKSNSHGAGIDAFMTGYVFACFLVKYGQEDVTEEKQSEISIKENGNHNKTHNVVKNEDEIKSNYNNINNDLNNHKNKNIGNKMREDWMGKELSECVDKVYLCGKDITLKVVGSEFTKPSKANLKLLASFEG